MISISLRVKLDCVVGVVGKRTFILMLFSSTYSLGTCVQTLSPAFFPKFTQRQIVFTGETDLKMKHHLAATDTPKFLG